MRRILLTMALGICGFGAFSQSIVTDRPDQTEASSTVGKGVLQVETGVTYQVNQPEMFRGKVEAYSWNTLWRLGITERWELRVVTQPEYGKVALDGKTQSKAGGIADLQLGFKVNLVEAKEGQPEVGFLSHLLVPTGSEGLSLNRYGVINKLAVTHSLGEIHTLAWNIGYDYFGLNNGNLFYSLAWGVGLTERLSVYLEPYGFVINMDELVFNTDAGITYLFTDDIQFDYSFAVGISQQMNYHSVGVSVRFPK